MVRVICVIAMFSYTIFITYLFNGVFLFGILCMGAAQCAVSVIAKIYAKIYAKILMCIYLAYGELNVYFNSVIKKVVTYVEDRE